MSVPYVIRTKITIPRRSPRILDRSRVTKKLGEALQHRVTILQAGAGYGKSTALLALANNNFPPIWYQVTVEDSDPLVFLLHLFHATARALPDGESLPLSTLEGWDGAQGRLPIEQFLHQYLNSINNAKDIPFLLILDDIHQIVDSHELTHLIELLISFAPPNLHILLAGRPPIKLPNLARWRARGEVLLLDQTLLAFTLEEIMQLFSMVFEYELTQAESEKLLKITEGWAITLQLIWQSLRSGAVMSIEDALSRQAASLESLFQILADDILSRQPQDVQDFMLVSATLRIMAPKSCDNLLEATGLRATNSQAMLSYLRREELFVVDLGDNQLRYQTIFHQFLCERAPLPNRIEWHRIAASYYQEKRELDEAIYHLIQAEAHVDAAKLLEDYGAILLGSGRLDTLASYLDTLDPDVLARFPDLLSYLGDLARLHSRFQEALGWYQQAETLWRERNQLGGVARALRGQARVYLDTVNPSRAEELLQQALRLSDGTSDRETQARLYELLAENKLNAGKVADAEDLRQQAELLRLEGPSDAQLITRVLLRTGRLDEARQQLETQEEIERRQPVQTPRAHRETLLLLSIIYAFQGEADAAYQTALEATQRGISLNSPFITAVGHMRQGHALSLLPGENRYLQARNQFEKAIEISRSLAIPRLRIEAYWGLCRAYGYQGDLNKALQSAKEAINLATQMGDEWIVSICRLSMGASLVLANRFEDASGWLEGAARGFQECSDPFGNVVSRLWLCIGWYKNDDHERLFQILPNLLANCGQAGYDFLFTKPNYLGPPDDRMLVPLLILARNNGWEMPYISRLLRSMGLHNIEYHPGYQLKIHTLGNFQVSLGAQSLPISGWRREKSRQLFQILLTFRDAPLDKEQLFEYLWPGAEPTAAQRNFKVTLNTLFQVLEPDRKPGEPSAFILREGTVYSIRPQADIWVDSELFKSICKRGEASFSQDPAKSIEILEKAIDLYQGDYLPDARYETWAAAEREYLEVLFLRTADILCEGYLEQGRYDDTIRLANQILAHDNCWERAYRHLMIAYNSMGDRGQMARIYQRCNRTLADELDVKPAQETLMLYQKFTQS